MHVKHVVWDRVYMFMQRGLSNRKHKYKLIEGIYIYVHALVVEEIGTVYK